MRALPGLRLEIQNASGAGDNRPLSPTQKKKENNVKSSSGAAASKWLENERKRKRLALSLERFFFFRRFFSTLPVCPHKGKPRCTTSSNASSRSYLASALLERGKRESSRKWRRRIEREMSKGDGACERRRRAL